jgi:Spy/CpxP family protein refolding chaperone
MRRFLLAGFTATILVGLTLAGTSAARPPLGGPGGPGGHEPGRVIDEHADELGLDEETREAIQGIVDASRKDAKDFREELRGLHDAMRTLLSQDEPDEAAVMKQAESIGKVETEMHKHRLSTLLAVRALLTPEQRAELTRIREETRGERRGRGGPRRGPRPPPGSGRGER